MARPENPIFTDGRLARSSGVWLRHASGLLLAFIALFAVVPLPGSGDLAHAQEPAITVRFDKDFDQYVESARRGTALLQARTAGSVPPTQDFTVTVVSEGDTRMSEDDPVALNQLTAVAGEDFTAVSATYAFRASDFVLENGRYVNTVDLEFDIHADDIIEKLEQFALQIQSTGLPPHVTLESTRYSRMTIVIRDDTGTVTLTATAPREVSEGEAFDVILSVDKEIAFPWTVVFSTVDGTASLMSLSNPHPDYVHTTQVVRVARGQRRKPVRVQTLEDNLVEGDEQFEIYVVRNGLDDTVILPENPAAIITIKDNDAPSWSVTVTPAELSSTPMPEAGGSWTMTVSAGGVVTWAEDQTIAFDFTDPPTAGDGYTDTATPGEDFEITDDSGVQQREPNTLILKAGSTEVTGTFTIVSDTRNELTEAVLITPRHGGVPITGPHTFTIIDDDGRDTPGAPRSPRLASGDGKVIVQWTAPRDPGNTLLLSYEYRLEAELSGNSWIEIPDSGPGGANHGRYGIARRNGRYTIVYLRAKNASGAGNIVHRGTMPFAGAPGAPGDFSAKWISESEFRLSWTEPAATPGATITGYIIERSPDGLADWGTYNIAVPGTTSTTGGIGLRTHYFRIRTQFRMDTPTVIDGMEFRWGMSETSPAVRAGTGEASVDPALPQIRVWDASAREGLDAAVDFTVRLRPASTSTVRVDYRTEDVRATAPEDYQAMSGTLVFAPGETEKTVSVPIVDDTVEDSGEEFALLLRNVSGARLGDEGAAGVIHNSETPAEEPGADAGEQAEAQAAVVDPPAAPLTASLQGMPAEHEGESVFTFGLTFSEAPKLSYKVLRDRAFDVTGGVVRRAQRRQQGSNLGWTITVEPAGGDDVSIALPGGRACAASGAVCTADGRILANTVSALVRGPAALSVADARTHEATGATLAFAVTLSRAASDTVTVDYATSDGTATAGADYTQASGTLTFAPGETQKTVNVAVLDDAHDDGGETLTLTLSNPSGAVLADAQASGVIENTDPLQRAWLARFGRVAAEHVMEAVGARIEGRSSGSTRLTLGGRRVPLDASWPAEGALPTSRTRAGDFGGLLTEGHAGPWREGDDYAARAVPMSELLRGSSFHLASAGTAEQGPRWSFWGRGAHSSFNGADGGLSLDGDVSTGIVSADYESGKMLVGVALSYSAGEGSYQMADAKGRLESTLASAHPYLRYAVSERLSLWGVVGLGRGELRIDPERSEERMEADLSTAMAAAGVRGGLPSGAGYDLAWKSDVLFVRSESDAAQGLAAAEAETRRLRLALEAARDVKLGDGVLRPSLEAGLRYDGGDAETGSGVELGGALRYSGSGGLTMEVRARGLLAHEQRGYEEWGVSSSVSFTPGEGGRGLSIRAGSSWGAASAGADRLWSQPTAAALVRNEGFEPGAASFEAEVSFELR